MTFHAHAFFLQLIENLQTWDVSANAGVTADLDPRGYGSPFADLDPSPPPSGFGPRSPYPLADLDRIWTAGTPAHETGSLYSFVVHLTKNLSAVEISS